MAISPTTFDDGVTFTMSPNISFTSSYAFLISSILSSKPKEMACGFRFEYCPPGISCL